MQEGLPVALMEAMASGLTCVVSNIRGNTDLVDKTIGDVVINRNSRSWVKAIKAIDMKMLNIYEKISVERIKQFDIFAVMRKMRSIYKEI